MGHPRNHHQPRERLSKRARKQLRHKGNQLVDLKQAFAAQSREYQKTMLWLLAVLRATGGAVVMQDELLLTQAKLGSLGWQAVPDVAGSPVLWTIRAVEAQQPAVSTENQPEPEPHEPVDEPATP